MGKTALTQGDRDMQVDEAGKVSSLTVLWGGVLP
jgi:hypothetical protein